ncbi:MAG: flagellin N-terminal helical domain-containing protein [Alkalilacustris sp.]
MSSILTNNGAMVALQTMRNINRDMGTVQNQIATGLKVATAKDNASSWAISKVMESDVAGFSVIADTLKSSSAMVSVARSAAEQVVSALTEIEKRVLQAREPGADTGKLQEEVNAFLATIASTAESAQFNGVNLVKATPDNATIVVSMVRDGAGTVTTTELAVTGVDLEALGDALTLSAGDDTALTELQTRLGVAINAAADFGAAQKRMELQGDFISKQMDALKSGIGALVDADMEETAARLQALQVQQQLGIQSLTIANQQPQNILALFR